MSHHYFSRILPFAICSLAVALSACQRTPTTTYIYGPLTATGTIIRADVSLVRRGTHTLTINGRKMYFLESKTVDLRSFEGQTVAIGGSLEPNATIDDLPVLVVSTAERVIGKGDLHTWEIPILGIRLSIPINWAGNISNGQASFALSGESQPIMTIEEMSGAVLPEGTPLYIQNRKSMEIRSATLAEDVLILDGDHILRLHFDPAGLEKVRTLEEGEVLAGQFQAILASIQFLDDQSNIILPTGSGSNAPCGGPAGILCPTGSYCDISDPVNQVGQCKSR